VATLAGKIVLSYAIVLISHFVGLSLIDPLLEDIKDTSTIYIGMIVFGASLTAMIILLLRLDWARILRRFAPWTLIEEDKKD
jgi:predicted MFS family arabinose efflux permease